MDALFQPFPMLPGRRGQVWRHQPAYRRPRHFHDEPEINLVLAGNAVLGVGDRTVRLSPGEMLLFQPGQDHVLVDASPDLELYVAALSPELAERALGLRALAAVCSHPFSAEAVATGAELEGVSATSDRDVVETRLAELFARGVEKARHTHVLSRRALESARSEPSLSAGALAGRLSTTPSGLSRRFHADLGVTLVHYRARLKLMRFIELVDGGQSLSRAALEADFGSYGQCHRVFRRAMGCSPQEYFRGARATIDRATISD